MVVRLHDAGQILASTSPEIYKSSYSYDRDGNILDLKRWDGGANMGQTSATAPAKVDDMSYDYQKLTSNGGDNNKHNQLQNVTDLVTNSPTAYTDIKPLTGPLPAGANTYAYDRIGNLIKDRRDGLDITWNVYGKAASIKKTVGTAVNTLYFSYDGAGNRISKDNVTVAAGTESHDGEWYVRDAAGNILAVYKHKSQYGKKSIIEAWNGDVAAAATTAQLAGFYTSIIEGEPAVAVSVLDAAAANEASWMGTAVSAKPSSWYVINDAALVNSMLTSTDGYLDDLQDYVDPEGQEGTDLIANAILGSDEGAVLSFLREAITAPAPAQAIYKHYGQTILSGGSDLLYEAFGQSFDPGDPDGSAEALAEVIGSTAEQDMAAMLLGQGMTKGTPEERFAFMDSLVSDDAVFGSADLRAGLNTIFEQSIMTVLQNEGDKAVLTGFINQWSPAAAWIESSITERERLGIIYNTEPEAFLTSLLDDAATGPDIINTALANESSLTLQEYADKLTGSGLTTAVALKDILDAPVLQAPYTFGILGEEFSLAEHHIYGSSRLGVQHYRSGPGSTTTTPVDPAHYGLTNKWTYGNAQATFSNLNIPSVWYSYEYGDLVSKTQKVPWGNWDRVAGSSGVMNASAEIPTLTSESYYNAGRWLGLRQYELTDHLGNVLATVLDRKVGSKNTANTDLTHSASYPVTYPDPNTPGIMINGTAPAVTVYDYWNADVASAQDYYPFGMEMPGRTYSSGVGLLERFGFNGQMKDDEVSGKGNSVDFKFRGYDTRIARFRSRDPLAFSYPWNSTYAFAENRPIDGMDLEGAERYWTADGRILGKYGTSTEMRIVTDAKVAEYAKSAFANLKVKGIDFGQFFTKTLPAASVKAYENTKQNEQMVLASWAKENRNNKREHVVSLFIGWVESDDPRYDFTDLFIEGSTGIAKGPDYQVGDPQSMVHPSLSVGMGVFTQRSTTSHTHPWGDYANFSNEPGGQGYMTGGDIQWSMDNHIDLYLVPPYGNTMGKFSPGLYEKYFPTLTPPSSYRDAVRSSVEAVPIE